MKNEFIYTGDNSTTNEVVSVSTGIFEAGIDSLMDESILKEIPILSTTLSIYRIGKSIWEKHYYRKLCSFILEFNSGLIDEEQRNYYRNKILEDIPQRNKELEYLLLILERFIQYDKADMLAKLYLSYLNETITWNELAKYAEAIDRFLPGDYDVLKSAAVYKTERDIETDAIQRLISLGLVIENIRTIVAVENEGHVSIDPPEVLEKSERNYKRTGFGDKLVSILN